MFTAIDWFLQDKPFGTIEPQEIASFSCTPGCLWRFKNASTKELILEFKTDENTPNNHHIDVGTIEKYTVKEDPKIVESVSALGIHCSEILAKFPRTRIKRAEAFLLNRTEVDKLIDEINIRCKTTGKKFVDVEYPPNKHNPGSAGQNPKFDAWSRIPDVAQSEIKMSHTLKSDDLGPWMEFDWKNTSAGEVLVTWLNYTGKETPVGNCWPGGIYSNSGCVGSVWIFKDREGAKLCTIRLTTSAIKPVYTIDDDLHGLEEFLKKSTGPVELPTVFTDGSSPYDIIQGQVGDCWLMAALSATGSTDRLETLIHPNTYNPHGVYAVTLQINGREVSVLVDDYVPTKQIAGVPTLVAGRCSKPYEMWVQIMEKAFTKITGGYDNIRGSSPNNVIGGSAGALAMLNGGVGKVFEWNDGNNVKATMAYLLRCTRMGMLCVLSSRGESDTMTSPTGIVQNHAYSLLSVQLLHTDDGHELRLVKIRNTWGNTEWNGDWSDNSDLWKKNTKLARQCDVDVANPKDDGIFWMELSDFMHHFDNVQHN